MGSGLIKPGEPGADGEAVVGAGSVAPDGVQVGAPDDAAQGEGDDDGVVGGAEDRYVARPLPAFISSSGEQLRYPFHPFGVLDGAVGALLGAQRFFFSGIVVAGVDELVIVDSSPCRADRGASHGWTTQLHPAVTAVRLDLEKGALAPPHPDLQAKDGHDLTHLLQIALAGNYSYHS